MTQAQSTISRAPSTSANAPTLDHRPQFHIRPPHGWINDPNGLLYHNGRYHVFFQYDPTSIRPELMCWGHVWSDDLVTWSQEQVAVAPHKNGPDAAGCWTGVAVVEDGVPTLVYTALRERPEDSSIALSPATDPDDPRLRVWHEPQIVEGMPPDDRIAQCRDPFVFHAGGHRWAIQGSGYHDGTAAVILYQVDALSDWQYKGTLCDTSMLSEPLLDVAGANVWECPQFIEVDGKWVLIVSLAHSQPTWRAAGVAAITGELDVSGPVPRFVPQSANLLDAGPEFYAPQVVALADRTLMWGWSWEPEPAPREDIATRGWAGILTLPRELRVREGRVESEPAAELVALRETALDASEPLADPAFEVIASSGPLTLSLAGPGGSRTVWEGDGPARIFVDGSIVEIYSQAIPTTRRIYPAGGERWVVTGSDVQVRRLALP